MFLSGYIDDLIDIIISMSNYIYVYVIQLDWLCFVSDNNCICYYEEKYRLSIIGGMH